MTRRTEICLFNCKAVRLFILLGLACSGAYTSAQLSPAAAAKFRQGTSALQQGQLDNAAASFESVIHDSPAFAEAYFNLGLVREQQGRFNDALVPLQHALALKPSLRGANLFLGIAQYRLNHYKPALAALGREVRVNSADAKAWMWLGVTQLAAEQPEEAVAALDKAAKLAPDDVDILYHRGRAHMLVSKQSYEHMLRADPGSWRVRQVLAQADAEANRYQDAIAEYQAAIKLAPEQPGLNEELGTQYWNNGEMEKAEGAYRRELEIDPESILAQYKLGSIRIERAKPREGKPLVEAALRQSPKLRDAQYYLGRADMQIGNDQAAVEEFKSAISGDSDPEIVQQAYYQLAQVYRRLHRTQEAQEALAVFQKLKNEGSENQQKRLEKKQGSSEPGDSSPNQN
ncbi:MAG: tetratricopeptide repeat protein [Acidobacteriota bacterium]|nr:tetratricopeptide repeat protein [Acidobacteriota bacterium]